MNKYNFSEAQEMLIIKKYREEEESVNNTARIASECLSIKVSQNAVSSVLQKYGVPIREKSQYYRKPSYRTMSNNVITKKIKNLVMRRFHALGGTMMSHGKIKTDVKNKFGVDLHYGMFEDILRESGVDLDSKEYRGIKNE